MFWKTSNRVFRLGLSDTDLVTRLEASLARPLFTHLGGGLERDPIPTTLKGKFMSKTEVISASLRTELHSAQSANSQSKPNDGFVDLHDFVFGDGLESGGAEAALSDPRNAAS